MNHKSAEGERLGTDQYRKVLDRWPVLLLHGQVVVGQSDTIMDFLRKTRT